MTNNLRIDCRKAGRDSELTSVLPDSAFSIHTHGASVPLTVDEYWSCAVMNEIVIVASSVADLKKLQLTADSFGSTKALRIFIAGRVPGNLLSTPPGIVNGRYALESRRKFGRTPIGHTEIYVKLDRQVPLKRVIAACLGGGLTTHRRVTPSLRIGLAPNLDSGWSFGDSMAKYLQASTLYPKEVGNNPGPKPEVDLLITAEVVEPLPLDHPPVIRIRETAGDTWKRIATAAPMGECSGFAADSDSRLSIPPVDTELINPVGFDSFPSSGSCSTRRSGHTGQRLVADTNSVILGHLDDGRLSERLVGALRTFAFVNDYPDSHVGPAQRASFLIDAAAAGVPVVPHNLDPLTARYLSNSLREVYSEATESLFEDRLSREAFVASAHRAAYRGHGNRNVLSLLLNAAGHGTRHNARPTISVLIPSKRPEFISNAIEQLRRQSWKSIQPIFGFHGFTLRDISVQDRNELSSMSALVHETAADSVFGDLMNTMTEMADGSLIAKMDDDDWYGEHHLEDLLHAHEYSRAILVGSGVRFIYLSGADITVRRALTQSYRYGGHPGGPTILLARDDLRSVGNWATVSRGIDTALTNAIAAAGGSVYQGNPLNFLFNKRDSGHTWNATSEYFLRGKTDQWVGLQPPPGFTEAAARQIRSRWAACGSALVGTDDFYDSCKPKEARQVHLSSSEVNFPNAIRLQDQRSVDPWKSSFDARRTGEMRRS
ncbi:hypothetical protein [Arthrobacter sp. PM3]|uniref:hypothetical protein n=1 Tax=Arthrobacter sp. PM3 TaxID=2017685 RepID=UPI001ABF8B5C|nr:hypothetical protein [Arthrobacter sp. PM3]